MRNTHGHGRTHNHIHTRTNDNFSKFKNRQWKYCQIEIDLNRQHSQWTYFISLFYGHLQNVPYGYPLINYSTIQYLWFIADFFMLPHFVNILWYKLEVWSEKGKRLGHISDLKVWTSALHVLSVILWAATLHGSETQKLTYCMTILIYLRVRSHQLQTIAFALPFNQWIKEMYCSCQSYSFPQEKL